ncbi:MAG: hypothetical protein K2N51_14360 [Lachnospiraceae bacterium]|nr:hypothetical protein [Lachnospiraceae bacterium]
MTENEKLDLILTKLEKLDKIESDMQIMKNEILGITNEIQELKQKVTSLELHIENATDKNIQLLAENFVELTKKLNQAIPVADKNLAYEVKVNYLLEEVQSLKEELAKLKNKIA